MKAVRDVADKLERIVADELLAAADLRGRCCSSSSHAASVAQAGRSGRTSLRVPEAAIFKPLPPGTTPVGVAFFALPARRGPDCNAARKAYHGGIPSPCSPEAAGAPLGRRRGSSARGGFTSQRCSSVFSRSLRYAWRIRQESDSQRSPGPVS